MKTVFKIGTSEDLNSAQAVLLMEVGEKHCCFGILDFANQMLVQVGYHTADEKDNGNLLEKILASNTELKQSFRQTVIGYYVSASVLTPSKFYRYDEAETVLNAMYDKGQYIAVSESITEWQLYNAYHVRTAVHGLLSRSYSSGNFWHVYSIALKSGIHANEGGTLLVDFKTDSFMLLAVKDKSLLIAQIFYYTRSEDVLYWLLKVCTQFSLSQNDVNLILSGLIDKQSAVFKELYQYFIHIDFAKIENDIQLSGDFEEYPVHFFSSLYKLALCAS